MSLSWAAVSGEERCVMTLITAAKETTCSVAILNRLLRDHGKLNDALSLVNLYFVAETCHRSVHTLWQWCFHSFCHCEKLHEFKPVWICATDCSDKILSQQQRFSQNFTISHELNCCGNCPHGVSQWLLAQCVSASNGLFRLFAANNATPN